MDANQVVNELIELRERVIRLETLIENIAQQQTAVETLAKSVQDIALTLRELTVQTNSNTKQLDEIEADFKKKTFYVWCSIIGGAIGAVISYFAGKLN